MSGLTLNLVCDPSQGGRSRGGRSRGNNKHQRFLGRVRYLESQGLLNDKQNKSQGKKNQQKKKRHPKKMQLSGGAVFPQFTSYSPNNTGEPSSSAQASPQQTAPLHSTPCSFHSDPAHKVCRSVGPSKYLAMDCEMVGTGPKGTHSELGRCSIVSYDGDIIFDKFIKPVNPVTDFRTRWSGIRRQDLVNALPFYQAQKEIVKIMTGKVVVGHAIHNDFKALKYFHPPCQTRDTARIPLLNQKAGMPEDQLVSLKKLTKAIFNKDIQTGTKGHSSVEDAKATMELYKVVERMWEQKLASQSLSAQSQTR